MRVIPLVPVPSDSIAGPHKGKKKKKSSLEKELERGFFSVLAAIGSQAARRLDDYLRISFSAKLARMLVLWLSMRMNSWAEFFM